MLTTGLLFARAVSHRATARAVRLFFTLHEVVFIYFARLSLNMDNLVVLILHHCVNETTSNVLGDVQAYLTRIHAKPLTIEKKGAALHVHYCTIAEAKNSAVKLLHMAEYAQKTHIAGYSMSFASVCGFALKNACMMKRTDGKTVDSSFGTSFHRDLARYIGSTEYATALAPSSQYVLIFLRYPKHKELLSNHGNQNHISVDGINWELIPTHRFRISRKPRKRKFIDTAERKYNKYLRFRERKAISLSTDVAEFVNNLNFSMIADERERSIAQLESWIDRVNYELYEREFNAAPSEQFESLLVEKLTVVNTILLTVKNTLDETVVLLRSCPNACVPTAVVTPNVQNSPTTVIGNATELQDDVEENVVFSFTPNDEY